MSIINALNPTTSFIRLEPTETLPLVIISNKDNVLEHKLKFANGDTFIFDIDDFANILNCAKHFICEETNIYPSYYATNRKISLLEFIYKRNPSVCNYKFLNNNCYDLRKNNIYIMDDEYYNTIKHLNKLELIYEGTPVVSGKYAGQNKNMIYKYLDDNNKEIYIMQCNQNKQCLLCPKSYAKIIEFEKKYNDGHKLIWTYITSGYIQSNYVQDLNKRLLIHQIILNYYGEGQGTIKRSVDHIDRNPLNNTYNNLRIATHEKQQQNTKGVIPKTKKDRQYIAQDLPEGLTQEMMPKYVNYNKECYDKKNNSYREFFRIEGHPNRDKIWSSSKSNKVSILDKLAETIKVLEQLDNGTYEEPIKLLPKYITLNTKKEKHQMIFEKRTDDKRLNLKMALPLDYDLDEQIEKMKQKIYNKYEVKYDDM